MGPLANQVANLKQLAGGLGFDFVFVDHIKDGYLSDLQLLLREGLLHPGSVVVADNLKVGDTRPTAAWRLPSVFCLP